LQRRTKSVLEELDSLIVHRDREKMLESRAQHIIQSAVNLINTLRDNYAPLIAEDLERRLINSIKGQDPSKFARGIRNIKKDIDENGNSETD
jgi:hypothetical protein